MLVDCEVNEVVTACIASIVYSVYILYPCIQINVEAHLNYASVIKSLYRWSEVVVVCVERLLRTIAVDGNTHLRTIWYHELYILITLTLLITSVVLKCNIHDFTTEVVKNYAHKLILDSLEL